MANKPGRKKQSEKPSLWLCLHFFELPLACWLIKNPAAKLAVAEKQRLTFISDTAQEAGIEVGMSIATAYALAPETSIEQRNIDVEVKTLRALAEWCYQFTPQVSLYKEFVIALEVSSSLRLFKGLRNLLTLIAQGLLDQGHRFQYGLAHSVHSAWLLSQTPQYNLKFNELVGIDALPRAEHFLPGIQKIPLSFLDIENKKRQQLHNIGLQTVGDILSLPRASLGKRFGKPLVDLIDAIVGEKPATQNTIEPADQYSEKIDFANGVSRLDEIIPTLEQMLRRFCYFLHFHHYHTALMVWRFYHFNVPCECVEVSTSPANNTLESFLSLSRLKLEKHTFKAPIECVELASENFIASSHRSQELFVDLSHPSNQLADYHFLLDKLINRLGDKTVFSLQQADEHLPDCRQSVSEINAQSIGTAIKYPERVSQHPCEQKKNTHCEPLWLRDKPIMVDYVAPQTLYHRGPLRIIYGPQRIDSHWWQQRQQRDYFIARHQNGAYYWVFQELKTAQWFLHGVFS